MFTFVRRILLRAASDPIPLTTEADSGAEDNMDTWGWPSPRSDSAEGLPFVVCRLRNLDRPMTKALRTLAKDPSRIVRYELAGSLFALHQSAPQLMWELIDHMIDHESKYRVLDELLTSLGRLLSHKMDALPRIQRIAKRVSQHAPKKHNIHEHLVSCFLFRFLRTGDTTCWDHVANLIRHCDDETNANSLAHQLHSCRKGRWLTAGDAIVSDTEADEHRMRAWRYFRELLSSAQQKLSFAREQWKLLHAEHPIDESRKETVQSQINVLGRIVDGIAGQLYFGSGAFSRKQQDNEDHLSVPQMRRFWNESADLFESLANELHPHTAKHVIEAMYHLMAADPHRTFLCAAKAIETSNAWGFLQESLVVDDIVRLIQRLLSDHSDVLRPSIAGYSECLEALLRVLDLFVDAGWAKARQLTHRLEEIYR